MKNQQQQTKKFPTEGSPIKEKPVDQKPEKIAKDQNERGSKKPQSQDRRK